MTAVVDDKALVLSDVADPHPILTAIKKSAVVNGQVVVRWGLEEASTLASTFKIKDVPSPIKRDYKWTGRHQPFDHQRETASFLTLHKRAFCFNEQGCVDSETEYLSPEGWVKISEYAGGKVAQYHPDTGTAEFVDPLKYVKLPCNQMVKIKTKYGLDQMLSLEHRVLLEDGKSKNPKREVLSALELLFRHDDYRRGRRSALGGTKNGTDKVAFSSAAIPSAFDIIGGAGIPLTDAELRVQIAVIADGYFGSGTTRCVVRLKKQRKIERLRKLLEAADIEFSETVPEYAGAKGFHIFKFNSPRRDKSFDAFYWAASRAQLEIVADEVLQWDGSTARGLRFSSSDKASADFVQYAFSATGKTARVTERSRERRGRVETEYTVQIRDVRRLYVRGSSATMDQVPSTDGFKYCFMVPSTFLIFRRNGCVFASGNTGKTASVIWAADYLMKLGKVKRVLVLCPLSIMKSAWQKDLFTFAMHRSCGIAHGTAQTRRKIMQGRTEFVIINFDGLAIVKDDVIKGGFDLIVVDEANAYKNSQTNRWKALRDVLASNDDMRLWMMTGTPAAQSPVDAFGLAKLVNPEGVPKWLGSFRDQVMLKVTQFKWVPKPDAQDRVHRALQPAIRFEKKDCLDLPPVTFVERDAPLTKQQYAYYRMLKSEMMFEAAGEEVTAVNAAVKINKLLQVASGAVYTEQGNVLEFDVSNRLNVVREVISEASNKVLVFVPFTHSIDLLRDALTKDGISCGVINGAVPPNKRSDIVEQFQTKADPHVLIIQPQAAAHGLTLTAADTVIWYAPVTSVETYLQANARINRPGQTSPMTVVHVQGSDVEAKLYGMLQANILSHEKIVDLYRQEFPEAA